MNIPHTSDTVQRSFCGFAMNSMGSWEIHISNPTLAMVMVMVMIYLWTMDSALKSFS